MKYILIIGDGIADNPVPELGGLTPLEYAKKPFIDELAARGEVGSVLNVPHGLPAGSDTAIMSMRCGGTSVRGLPSYRPSRQGAQTPGR